MPLRHAPGDPTPTVSKLPRGPSAARASYGTVLRGRLSVLRFDLGSVKRRYLGWPLAFGDHGFERAHRGQDAATELSLLVRSFALR